MRYPLLKATVHEASNLKKKLARIHPKSRSLSEKDRHLEGLDV
jgi:hypothetical protein